MSDAALTVVPVEATSYGAVLLASYLSLEGEATLADSRNDTNMRDRLHQAMDSLYLALPEWHRQLLDSRSL
jgi:hypothetical protein